MTVSAQFKSAIKQALMNAMDIELFLKLQQKALIKIRELVPQYIYPFSK